MKCLLFECENETIGNYKFCNSSDGWHFGRHLAIISGDTARKAKYSVEEWPDLFDADSESKDFVHSTRTLKDDYTIQELIYYSQFL